MTMGMPTTTNYHGDEHANDENHGHDGNESDGGWAVMAAMRIVMEMAMMKQTMAMMTCMMTVTTTSPVRNRSISPSLITVSELSKSH